LCDLRVRVLRWREGGRLEGIEFPRHSSLAT
jgi:hypothetical protein